ncbi:hypothetical protein D3C76_452190 [compost metagenome]
MNKPTYLTPSSVHGAKKNIGKFVDWVRNNFVPLLDKNSFESNIWQIDGLTQKCSNHKCIYFTQAHIRRLRKMKTEIETTDSSAAIHETLLLRQPFRSFAKAMLIYMHGFNKTVDIVTRLRAFCYFEEALFELTSSSCPAATTPEILNRACNTIKERYCHTTTYTMSIQLRLMYKHMIELGLVAAPTHWTPPIHAPNYSRNKIGKEFDEIRNKKLPSAESLDALASIFNGDNNDPKTIFVSSACALMLCSPDRASELLFAPFDILAPDWVDPDTGAIGTALRWFPAKGAAPMVKTVIPSMRDVCRRAVERIQNLSAPARKLALWYESNPTAIYLPPSLEHLRGRHTINQDETHSILFGLTPLSPLPTQRTRTRTWLDAHNVPRISRYGIAGTKVKFSDLENAVLGRLPEGFPIMDPATGMRYSEALCLARESEFNSIASGPSQCCFSNIKYKIISSGLKSHGHSKSIFELGNHYDNNENSLTLTSHQLRHYLNTLVRHSGQLTEDEIAKWSGRRNANHNATYNHESDRDIIAKLRSAIGDPSITIGPLANIDNRTFIRRDEFAAIKIITAHTTENGYCIHDYTQSPCQVHQDCTNCDEHLCIKGDLRAEKNLRQTQSELIALQDEARKAFSAEVLGSAEWFQYHSQSLERVNKLIAILDDPKIVDGAVIQLSGIVPPSRIAMAEEIRNQLKPIAKTITSVTEVRTLLLNNSDQDEEPQDGG